MSASTIAAWTTALVVVAGAGVAGAVSGDSGGTPRPEPSPTASPSTSPSPIGSLAPTPTTTPMSSPVEVAQLAAVKLTWPCGDDLEECTTGSGSVVDPSGLIVTNAHVAAPTAPGLVGQYGDGLAELVDPAYLTVSVPPSPEADAEPRYRATLVAADGYADLAVVKVVANADGSPLAGAPDLTSVPLGRLADARKDDEIRIVGYPASGDSASPTVQRGTIASKPADPDERVTGPWELNTSAPIHSGNSGGLVVDAQGRLIAVPAYSKGFSEQVYRARAVELAVPLLRAARDGAAYVTPYLSPSPYSARLESGSWLDEEPDGCLAQPRMSVAPGSTEVYVQAKLGGMGPGEHVRIAVTGPSGDEVAGFQAVLGAQLCLTARFSGDPTYDEELPVDAGAYVLTAYAGPDLRSLGRQTVTLPSG